MDHTPMRSRCLDLHQKSINKSPPKLDEQPAKNLALVHTSRASSTSHKRVQGRRLFDKARSSTPSFTDVLVSTTYRGLIGFLP